MKKIFMTLAMVLILAASANAAEKYIAQDNKYDITGYVLLDNEKAYMEVEDAKGNASCFTGKIVSSYKPIEATSFAKDVTLQFEQQGDELWVLPISPSEALTCGKGPVKFDRIVFKKEAK